MCAVSDFAHLSHSRISSQFCHSGPDMRQHSYWQYDERTSFFLGSRFAELIFGSSVLHGLHCQSHAQIMLVVPTQLERSDGQITSGERDRHAHVSKYT